MEMLKALSTIWRAYSRNQTFFVFEIRYRLALFSAASTSSYRMVNIYWPSDVTARLSGVYMHWFL